MKRLLYLVVVVAIMMGAVEIAGQNTRRRGLKVKKEYVAKERAGTTVADTIEPTEKDVTLSGYDKPLKSGYETVFVTNHLERSLQSVKLNIQYRDQKGRQLHQVERWISCSIPPGETRMVTFSSWDRQQSFYYKHSRIPLRATGTAYDVFVTIPAVVIRAVD